ncbi:MAG: hypothetical protein QXE81_03950 [Desulfurococcaceae archaeon]
MENNVIQRVIYSDREMGFEVIHSIIDQVVYYLQDYSKTWSDETYNMFLKSFNEYLEQATPIKYHGDRIDASKLSKLHDILPLWGIQVDNEKLRKLLVKLLETRKNPLNTNIFELREIITNFLGSVGVEDPESVVEQCRVQDSEGECLIYIAILALVLATNP